MIFSRKTKKLSPYLLFNDIPLKNSILQKHIGLILDLKLNVVEHIKNITQKICKTMGLLLRFQPIPPRSSLLTIYKTIIRSQLDIADAIYDQAYNSRFHENLEAIQYNACLEITGTIGRTSLEKLYLELGLESLKSRRWFRKICHFYKILNEKSPSYLFDLIHSLNIEFVKPDIAIRFLQFIQDTTISRIHSFLLLYLNGIILIAKLETHEVSQFLKEPAKLYTTFCK